ncbi:MAG: metalloregulator ArsR/SmtB family transcription factor, partial [Desulfovibrionaceae bacterium]|nr:metalloregulator ArsR/SmtB family transcription factor [Desulfovibrionaceae bacterium]
MSNALQYFKALSDATRLRLVLVLRRYELNVNELVELLGMGQSRVSRHLKILASTGLLGSRRDGLWVFYSIAAEGPGRDFIEAVYPFLYAGDSAREDLALASGIVEERTSRTSRFFNRIAEDWEAMSGKLLGAFSLPLAVEVFLPERCRVAVDLGCGPGNMLERLLAHADEVIGVDGSARMLELARRRFGGYGERLSLRIGDLEHLPLRDGEADFICLNLVLHHLSNPKAALLEIKRVLGQGGIFLLSEFGKHEDESLRREYGDLWLGFDLAL